MNTRRAGSAASVLGKSKHFRAQCCLHFRPAGNEWKTEGGLGVLLVVLVKQSKEVIYYFLSLKNCLLGLLMHHGRFHMCLTAKQKNPDFYPAHLCNTQF